MRTSGTDRKACLTWRRTREASWVETLDGRRKLTQIVPSSSSGKNSEPSRLATPIDRAKALKAITTTMNRRLTAQSSTGA